MIPQVYWDDFIGARLSKAHNSELPMHLWYCQPWANNYGKNPKKLRICLYHRPCHSEINSNNYMVLCYRPCQVKCKLSTCRGGFTGLTLMASIRTYIIIICIDKYSLIEQSSYVKVYILLEQSWSMLIKILWLYIHTYMTKLVWNIKQGRWGA